MVSFLKMKDHLPLGYIDENFLTYLNSQGFVVNHIIGDGNCLFRSIADIIVGDQEKHSRYRRLAVQHISAHQNHFEGFLTSAEDTIPKYLEKMA